MNIIPGNPMYINRFDTGLYTQRSPLVTPTSYAGLHQFQRFDALIDGLNVEISNLFTVQRRPGFPKWSTQQAGGDEIPRQFYSFRDLNGTIRIVADLTARTSQYTTTSKTTLFANSGGSGQTSFQSVGSMLYMCNGVDLKKWDGTTVTTWGITSPAVAPTITAVSSSNKAPGTAAGTNWTNPNNVKVLDTTYAVYNTTTQDFLKLTNFGYSLPTTVTITGVEVNITGNGTSATTAQRVISVSLTKDGTTATGTAKTLTLPQTTDSTQTLGSATDVWSATLAKADIEASTFGVLIKDNDATAAALNLDYVGVTVYYNVTGGLSPVAGGYTYVFAYKNSTTGHYSSASPASASTGNSAVRAIQVALSGSSSADAQVDKVEIFRTKDGGSTYFFVAEIANGGTWNYTDTIADTSLNTAIIAPTGGINDPPPAGMSLTTFHMGRMWGAVNNKVYWAAGGDTFIGVPEEAWPGLNYFSFPGKVTAMVSSSYGLIVFTASDAYIIRGLDTFSFFAQQMQANMGVQTQNCVARFSDQIFLYASQGQLYSFSSDLEEIGFPVGDLLPTNFSPATSYIAVHRAGPDSALYISNGSTNMQRYSFTTQSWGSVAQPVGGIGAIASCETTSAVYKLLAGRATASGYILNRDLTTFADDGSSYGAYATIGSFVLAPPSTLVEVDSLYIERQAVGTEFTVAILPDEISGSFTTIPNPVAEPPQLVASTTVIANRYYLRAVATPLPAIMRHCQIKVTFPTEAAKNELLGLGILPRQLTQ